MRFPLFEIVACHPDLISACHYYQFIYLPQSISVNINIIKRILHSVTLTFFAIFTSVCILISRSICQSYSSTQTLPHALQMSSNIVPPILNPTTQPAFSPKKLLDQHSPSVQIVRANLLRRLACTIFAHSRYIYIHPSLMICAEELVFFENNSLYFLDGPSALSHVTAHLSGLAMRQFIIPTTYYFALRALCFSIPYPPAGCDNLARSALTSAIHSFILHMKKLIQLGELAVLCKMTALRSATRLHQPLRRLRSSSLTRNPSPKPGYEGLSQLGEATTSPASPDSAVLERVPNAHPDAKYVSRFTCPEFTSICPVTGQPDFAHIVIDCVPDQWLVESKSLKLFLTSFRNHGDFHEACTVKIAKRIVECIEPTWLRIGGYWYPRGGIPIDIFYATGEPPAGVWIPDQGCPAYRGRG